MSETKQQVVVSVPAADLPESLRGEFDPKDTVTVTVRAKTAPEPTFADVFESLHESRVLSDDPVLRVRALREEWEERDRFHDQIRRGGTKD